MFDFDTNDRKINAVVTLDMLNIRQIDQYYVRMSMTYKRANFFFSLKNRPFFFSIFNLGSVNVMLYRRAVFLKFRYITRFIDLNWYRIRSVRPSGGQALAHMIHTFSRWYFLNFTDFEIENCRKWRELNWEYDLMWKNS